MFSEIKHTSGLILAMVWITGCGKKDDDKNKKIQVNVTAQSLALSSQNLWASHLLNPGAEEGGYEGIGVNYGDSIVDGLKVKISGIGMSGVPGRADGSPNITVFDWSSDPQELAIESGLNDKLQQTVEIEGKEGEYGAMTVNFRNAFSVKAYAYLDANNDGSIDTTIYTTPDGVRKVENKLAREALTDYGYFDYKFALIGSAQSLDASNEDFMIATIFPSPVQIQANGEVVTQAEDGTTETKKSTALSVDLAIDSYRIVKAWDGRYGNAPYQAGDGSIPSPVYPFPQSDNDSRQLSGDLKTYDFYPPGQPAFGLGDYLSTYAFPNMTSIKAQVYLVAKDESFNPFNIQVFTLILDDQDKPLTGKFSLGEGSETLHIGSAARLFTKQADGSYQFATSGGMENEAGVNDGGLFYNNDATMAGHLFENFQVLDTVGSSGTLLMKDGPRCASEYDYCVGAAGKTVYFKRVK